MEQELTEIQKASKLLQEHNAQLEERAAQALEELIKKWEVDYNATFSITQPQIIVRLK
jgi:hypothetical protein